MAPEEEKKLAEAMLRLAEALERVTNPETWRTLWEIGVVRMTEGLRESRLFQALPLTLPTPLAAAEAPGVAVGRVEEISISLTPEERERLARIVVQTLTPQIAQFHQFVAEAVAALPVQKLQEAARRIEAGKPVKLTRKQGCVFLEFPDSDPRLSESFYLRL